MWIIFAFTIACQRESPPSDVLDPQEPVTVTPKEEIDPVLSDIIEAEGIKGPALLIIGAVAGLPAEAQNKILAEAIA